jgi:hypothetical protein
MNYGLYIGAIITLILCILDLHKHNRIVEELFPDYDKDYKMRSNLLIEMYGFYFLLAILVIGFVLFIIGEANK